MTTTTTKSDLYLLLTLFTEDAVMALTGDNPYTECYLHNLANTVSDYVYWAERTRHG